MPKIIEKVLHFMKIKKHFVQIDFFFLPKIMLRWLNRVMQDHEARASDLNRKLIFSFCLLFS